MKKWYSLAGVGVMACALVIAGCGSDKQSEKAASPAPSVTIKVGASPVPHAEILGNVKEALAKEGINLQVIEFTDYVQPNLALNDKELDANFFQHQPYLDNFNSEHNLKLVSAGAVHLEPMGVYSSKLKDLSGLPDGAKVAIPNDPTNGGRALLLLKAAGLIDLQKNAGITATVADIIANPKGLAFSELEAAQLPRAINDVDIAVINTNYAIDAGMNPISDALYLESKDSPYANIVAIRDGDQQRPEIEKLMKALQSESTKKFISDKYKGAIISAF